MRRVPMQAVYLECVPTKKWGQNKKQYSGCVNVVLQLLIVTLFFYSHAKITPQALYLRFASFVDPLFFHPPLCFSFLGSVFFSQGSKGGGKERRNPRRRQTDSKTAAAAAAAVQAAFLVSRQGKNSLFRISPSWTENGNREFPANLWEKSANVGFSFPFSSSRVRPERARKGEEVDRG